MARLITGMEYIRRLMRARPTFWEALLRSTLAVIIPTLLRWLLAGDYYGAPFVLYFPAILMIAIVLGWRWAALTAVGSAVVAVYLFWPPSFWTVGQQQVAVMVMFILSAATMIGIGQLLRDAVIEIDARAQQSEDFNRELQHRTKNSIQMMRALASQASKATDPAEFYDTLGGRLGALAKANELLRFGALEACGMEELVRAAVAPFGTAQISYSGPPCRVSRNGCTPLMMALHELCTNASKYGALSNQQGRVRISWGIDDIGETIELTWKETGGPPVRPPSRKGIGARLLSANGDMRRVKIDYALDGVVCELSLAQA